MTDDDIETLLRFYKPNTVPSLNEVRKGSKAPRFSLRSVLRWLW
jgi:hypothetical protein